MTRHIYRSQLTSRHAAPTPSRGARNAWRWGSLAIVGAGALAVAMSLKATPGGVVRIALGGASPAHAAAPAFHADCSASPSPLQDRLTALAQGFDGEVGIAVVKAGCDWEVGARLAEFFPQQSVSKLWVSLSVLDAVDRGRMKLEQAVAIGPNDLTLFNQPLRAEVLELGHVEKPASSLMFAALSRSDNTANDRLLWTVGGPDQVRMTLKAKGISGIRFGPGERLLQSQIAGVTWRQDMSLGRNFEQARVLLPMGLRQDLLENYMADPMDGATPAGIARAMAALPTGRLLSPQSTAVMMDVLSKTHSGPMRLKAGAPVGWKVFHKTGTGQELGRVATGYNDVGILQAPDGSYYGVAVMIRRTTMPIPVRMELMQSVSRAVGQFHAGASTK